MTALVVRLDQLEGVTAQMAAMTDRIIDEAIEAAIIRARLDEWVSHAIERAPTVAAWVTGRAALGRVR